MSTTGAIPESVTMATTSCLKVGVVQMDCKLGDVEHNFRQHLLMLEQARSAGVKLLLFPELSLTGYGLGGLVPTVALQRNSALIQKLAQAAGDMTVVFGFVEEGAAAQFYNVAAAVRNGQLLHVHRKLNLPTYGQLVEGKVFAHGQRVETFDLGKPWTAGLLVCADWWNPPLVHLAVQQEATVMLAPINSALGVVSDDFSNPEGWDLALRFYAMVYGVPILMANRIGDERGAHFFGGSCIIGPRGQVLAQAEHDTHCLLTAELPYQALRSARFDLPTLRDADLPLLQREFTRLAQRAGN